jgi:DNA polymerase V
LVDANSFYCSAERIFRPDLERVPLVVLSNNDGCVVARDHLVKALGIPMAVPWHEVKDQARAHGIVAFSSNYTLYGDVSRRFMSVLGQYVPPEDHEIYSIDESFLDFTHQPSANLTAVGQDIKQRVRQWVGLPVCVGFGSSRTLAKLANRIAKKDSAWNGVCDLTALSTADLEEVMGTVEVGDVWGVGRRLSAQLNDLGINTAADLRAADPRRIRERFTVVVERTVRELRGIACAGLETTATAKQQIISSRAFGAPVYELQELMEPLHQHTCRAAEKLRQQGSVAGTIGVWIQTNIFRPQDPQYLPQRTLRLPEATDDSAWLCAWASAVLRSIYKPGFRYVKAGVMLLDIQEHGIKQGQLFGAAPPEQDARRARLMQTLDKANTKWGRGSMGIGHAGIKGERRWAMQRQNLSPRYTTCWDELRTVS